jgi:acyl dehydratase
MAVNTSYAGRVYPPGEVYRVSAEKIREFAEATASTHPAHTDVEAARALGYADVVAPPTFAVVVAQRAESVYVQDPEAGIDFSRVVHAEERFTHHRPIVAGDVLTPTLHVDGVVERGPLAMVTTRVEIADAEGAPVASVTSTLAVRGEDA